MNPVKHAMLTDDTLRSLVERMEGVLGLLLDDNEIIGTSIIGTYDAYCATIFYRKRV